MSSVLSYGRMRSSNDSRRSNTGTDRGHVRRLKCSIADADQRSGAKRSKTDGKTPLDQIVHPHQILSRSSNALENVWSNLWPATDQQCQNISQGNKLWTMCGQLQVNQAKHQRFGQCVKRRVGSYVPTTHEQELHKCSSSFSFARSYLPQQTKFQD